MAQVQSQNVGHRGFYSLEQVRERIPVSRATIYRLIREGKFPRGVRITRQRFGWPKDAVDAHCAQLMKNQLAA
jgi:predicted DNA-binding transcriptional regulator AlpA